MPETPAEADATEAGMIMGTAEYMSPEQAQGKPVADAWRLLEEAQVGNPRHSRVPWVMAAALLVAVAALGHGDPHEYWQIGHEVPGLQDFWQLHRSAAGDADHN